LSARWLRDNLGVIRWRDVQGVERSEVGGKVFLSFTLPRKKYIVRKHPHDDGFGATDEISWSLQISGWDVSADEIEASVREWAGR
jgi:hypothetical protein